MSLPRQVLPGRFYMITRRCTQRMFLMRPDRETNRAFLYCLALAAAYANVVVVYACAMSNHHHTVIYDVDGTYPKFIEHFHKLFAKCQNALRGRWENFWASEKTSVVHLAKPSDVIAKIVYAAANPVKANLVVRATQWPGINSLVAFMDGREVTAERPTRFFSKGGDMPEALTLRFQIPAELGDADEVRAQVRAGVAEAEAKAAARRQESGSRIVGRARCKGQNWASRPTTEEPRRQLDPTVAARNQWARVEALDRNRNFVDAYRRARRDWLNGLATSFPPGTYWLRLHAGVPIATV